MSKSKGRQGAVTDPRLEREPYLPFATGDWRDRRDMSRLVTPVTLHANGERVVLPFQPGVCVTSVTCHGVLVVTQAGGVTGGRGPTAPDPALSRSRPHAWKFLCHADGTRRTFGFGEFHHRDRDPAGSRSRRVEAAARRQDREIAGRGRVEVVGRIP